MQTVFETTDLAFPIKVEQRSNRKFRVTYGKQTSDKLTYEQAARELGYSIFHALACDGKLDNS